MLVQSYIAQTAPSIPATLQGSALRSALLQLMKVKALGGNLWRCLPLLPTELQMFLLKSPNTLLQQSLLLIDFSLLRCSCSTPPRFLLPFLGAIAPTISAHFFCTSIVQSTTVFNRTFFECIYICLYHIVYLCFFAHFVAIFLNAVSTTCAFCALPFLAP